MAKSRTSRQPSASLRAKLVKLAAALEACEHAVHKLQAENETHIKRMGAIQAEIDHLRAKGNS